MWILLGWSLGPASPITSVVASFAASPAIGGSGGSLVGGGWDEGPVGEWAFGLDVVRGFAAGALDVGDGGPYSVLFSVDEDRGECRDPFLDLGVVSGGRLDVPVPVAECFAGLPLALDVEGSCGFDEPLACVSLLEDEFGDEVVVGG